MSILHEIISRKKEELEETKSGMPLSELKSRIRDMDSTKDFRGAISRKPGSSVKLIAELKKASPSKGLIREDFSLSRIVSVYDKKDGAAISVLTEGHYFQGTLNHLNQARTKTSRPLLRKDFIVDEYQVYDSRANHADAILLIAGGLERSQLTDLFELAKELGIACLTEVHNWKELDKVLYLGADIVGINNRDLNTLNISLDITFSLLKDIPDDRIIVSESGISSREDVLSIEATRTDAILVGSTIMESEDIGSAIDKLTGRA